MDHSAEFIFKTPNAERIYWALFPEQESDFGKKSLVQLSCSGNTLKLSVQAEDVSAMRASLNMWLRLINVSSELLEL
ncbi:MAG TPA: KEOPS complex subunit Pcc1 [Methanocorpusculum sp.]|nr:KEOPS complex subunit Pcc1 [Methanocorpusculum sp.]